MSARPSAALDEGDLRQIVDACADALAEHAGVAGPRSAIAEQLDQHVTNLALRLRKVAAERDELARRLATLEGR